MVALEGRQIKKVKGSWFCRWQLNFKFIQEAVEKDEDSVYQSWGDVSQGDNLGALGMEGGDGGDNELEEEGDDEEGGDDEGRMNPFQVIPYFLFRSYHISYHMIHFSHTKNFMKIFRGALMG